MLTASWARWTSFVASGQRGQGLVDLTDLVAGGALALEQGVPRLLDARGVSSSDLEPAVSTAEAPLDGGASVGVACADHLTTQGAGGIVGIRRDEADRCESRLLLCQLGGLAVVGRGELLESPDLLADDRGPGR